MAKFSEEDVRKLRANIYVKQVNDEQILFSEEFKMLAWSEIKSGKKMPEVFRENGIDPEILGAKRIENFRYLLKRRAREGKGFSDNRCENGRQEKEKTALSQEDRIRELEHELAYTRQEVEFLKKIQEANTEARKAWELKHGRK